jgi:hypothetical protein
LRPLAGVSAELLALTAVIWAGYFVPSGISYLIYVVAAQLLATYLIHCPAHYFVGRAFGIRFTRIGLGKTTLARALPPQLGRIAGLIPILTLSIDKTSFAGLPQSRISAMYMSGVVASSAIAFAIAAAVTGGPVWTTVAAWLVALGYLLFDIVFSPRSGDVMRARRIRRLPLGKPVGTQE